MDLNFKNYFALLVNEATREDIKKFYPQIGDKDYSTVLDSDPTGTKDKVGSLSRLVLDLYKKDKFDLKKETLLNIYAAFDIIQKKKNSLIGTEFEKFRNLNMIPSAKTLLDIKYYLDQKTLSKIKLKASEGQDVDIFYEDENWVVKVPLDYKASVKIGRDVGNVKWCTASSDAMYYFNIYIARSDIYVFINKHTNEAYQYYEGDENSFSDVSEFEDIEKKAVNFEVFATKNNMSDVFDKIKTENKKIRTDKKYYAERLLKRYEQTKSPYIIIIALGKVYDKNLIDKLFEIHKPNLDEKLLVSINEETRQKKHTTLNLELYVVGSKYSTKTYDETTIKALCERYGIENYSINPDLSIDVKGDVDFERCDFKIIPLKFRFVIGDFNCKRVPLEYLKNAPLKIFGTFTCWGGKKFDPDFFWPIPRYIEELVYETDESLEDEDKEEFYERYYKVAFIGSITFK